MMPMRIRSFAPNTLEAASVPARPEATLPIKLRRDCMGKLLLGCLWEQPNYTLYCRFTVTGFELPTVLVAVTVTDPMAWVLPSTVNGCVSLKPPGGSIRSGALAVGRLQRLARRRVEQEHHLSNLPRVGIARGHHRETRAVARGGDARIPRQHRNGRRDRDGGPAPA